jgi:predicted transcriptional regulator
MYIMLSIHPEYAEKIFSGIKLWEYRKKVPAGDEAAQIKGVVVYATAPVSRLIGEFTTDFTKVLRHDIKTLRCRTHAASLGGIAPEDFSNYFEGREYGYGIPIFETLRYDQAGVQPALADFGVKKPPQGWVYLEDYDGFKPSAASGVTVLS